ncbi:MAG: hypothetical protein LLG04_07490 [Parachlamydia sp.]|nr:hypothetical protein [Parachlamydia sp.]
MASRGHETSNLSLLEAVEALSSIADFEMDREIGIAQRHELIVQENPLTYRTVHWLHKQGATETVQMIKEIFKVILNYLRNYYNKEYRSVTEPQAVEGIKTIMVLVGEVAKKLDRYTHLFAEKKSSVTELKEYKQLQEFYLTRFARKVDDRMLGKWLLELTKKAWKEGGRLKLTGKPAIETKHVFVDMEGVRKDSEYELLLMRKEDGSRFYSPRLIRNIKLVCDFGDYFPGSKVEADPLDDVAIWQDKVCRSSAKEILSALGQNLHRFYREALRLKDREIIEYLNKALMALMLAANPQNQLRDAQLKCCREYFADFQRYLRSALRTDDYHKLITYPPKASDRVAHCVLDVAHGLCLALFENVQSFQEIASFIQNIIQEAREKQSPEHEKAVKALWSGISCDGAALVKLFKHHTAGPLYKMLEVLQNSGVQSFDPISQRDLPCRLYALGMTENKVVNILLPSPTHQEIIHKASVIDEFKGFLRGCLKNQFFRRHLLINLQDRTSWREHARCSVLEELQHQEEFDGALTVVTLAKDTEFYHQLAPYSHENRADIFIQNFKDMLQDVNAGFYFPNEIANKIFPHFMEGVIDAIHRVFFSGRNVLSKEHRLDFIEIFYLFLQLKLIEIVKPDSFSLTCKDGVDIGPAASVQLYAFMQMIGSDKSTEAAERDQMNLILHAPALMLRNRLIQPERFNRMVSAIRCLESTRIQNGDEQFTLIIRDAFGDYFKSHILKAMLLR